MQLLDYYVKRDALFIPFFLIALTSCGPNSDITFRPLPTGSSQSSNQDNSSAEEVVNSGPETLIISGIFAADNDARDGKVFCIAQGEELSSCIAEIDDDDGSFSCDGIYADSPATCFLRNSTNNTTLATIEFTEDDNVTYPGYLSRSTLAISLTGAVDLGNLSYDSTNPLISVNFSNVEAKLNLESNSIDTSNLHDKDFEMTCVNTGNISQYNNCLDEIECEGCDTISDNIYFRNISATNESGNITVLGLWDFKSNFTPCGSFDLNDFMFNNFSNNNISISESTSIDDWSLGDHCPYDNWVDSTRILPGNIASFYNLSTSPFNSNFLSHYNKTTWEYTEQVDFGGGNIIDFNCIVKYISYFYVYKDSLSNIYMYIKREKYDDSQSECTTSDTNSIDYFVQISERSD